ncbi:MAG: glycosyl transferase family 4 [Xanthomonadales bacterium]|nr:glycosyl transferase family 4 [Xanthomonadales bacterium]
MTAILHIGLALLAAFFVAGVVIPAIDGPAHRFGLIDHPDHRKRHANPTPLTGGLGIFAGFVVALLILGLPMAPYWSLILGMIVLLLTGLADDLIEVSASARLLIQIGVGCLMVYGGGLSVNMLGEVFGPAYGPVGLGFFAGPFTVACVVFMVNAINMSDGLDGLAGGSGLFIFALLALAGWMSGASMDLVVIPMMLALATLGFLVHNLRMPGRERARAFLGDAGSMMMGFAIAWLAVAIYKDPDSEIQAISMAWILIVPGMDTLALFFRRIHLGKSPFAPDRTHLHHIFRRCGYGVVTTVHLIHLLVVATGLFGILAWQYGWPEWIMFAGAAGVLLGYQVFLANAHRVLRWHRRRAKARIAG